MQSTYESTLRLQTSRLVRVRTHSVNPTKAKRDGMVESRWPDVALRCNRYSATANLSTKGAELELSRARIC